MFARTAPSARRPPMRRALALALALALTGLAGAAATARAGTLTVGPGRQFARPCQAIAAARPGDVIEVDAGHYDGDTCAWSTDGLTVRGVGGRAVIDLTGVTPAEQKGIFTIHADNATIENFELSHAAISQAAGNNGAGIRHQGTNLTVRNCYLHDNQDGILGAPPTAGTGTVLIEGSELADNGAGDGQSHNAYLNHYASVTLRASYSHGARVGHLFKTRAERNYILYDRLTDEAGATASYELDVPNGGTTFVIGNLIEQAATSQNGGIVEYAGEGASNPDQHLYVVNNTVVNDRAGGTFLLLAGTPTVLVANNLLVGPGGLPAASATVTLDHNWTDADGDPMLVARAAFDYHLAAGSPAVDRGAALGMAGAMSLVPDRQYVHPRASEPRAVAGAAIDVGAYELGGAVGPEAGTGPDRDAGEPDAGPGVDGGDGGGCGCRASSAGGGGGAGGLALVLAVLAWIARRPRPPSRAPRAAVALAVVLVLAPAVAFAGPRRSGLYGGGALGGEAVSSGERTGGGVVFLGHLGYLAGVEARIGFEGELMGGEAWVGGDRRVDAVILGGLRLWVHDRVSLTLGLGLTAGDDTADDQVVGGGGAAAGASLGLELHRAGKHALWLRAHTYGGRFADARAIHVGLTLGLEWYGLASPTPGT